MNISSSSESKVTIPSGEMAFQFKSAGAIEDQQNHESSLLEQMYEVSKRQTELLRQQLELEEQKK